MVIKKNSDKVTKIDSRLFNKPNLLLIFFIFTLLILCLLLILEYLEVINIIKRKKNDKNEGDTTKSSEKPVSNIPIDKPVIDKPINKPIDNTNETKTSLSVSDVLSIIALSLGAILLFYFLFKFVEGAYAFINFFKGWLPFVFAALIMIIIGLVTDIPFVSNTLRDIGLVFILLISLWIFFSRTFINLTKKLFYILSALGLVNAEFLQSYEELKKAEEVEEKLEPLKKKLNNDKKNLESSEAVEKAKEKFENNLLNAYTEREEKKALDIYEKEIAKLVNKNEGFRNKRGSDSNKKIRQKQAKLYITKSIVAATLVSMVGKDLINEDSSLIREIDVNQPNMILFDEIQETNNNLDISLSDTATISESGYNKNNENFKSVKSKIKDAKNTVNKIPQFTTEFVKNVEENIKENVKKKGENIDSIEEQKEFNEDIAEPKEIFSNSKYSVSA
ncbi:MAG: hypothetical protein GY823_12910 [Flavobacteriaceae bacterium]|nr:hypothetical protein [Flavobacteriaceae bacterium]